MGAHLYNDAYLMDTPEWAFWEKGGQQYYETTFLLPFGTSLSGKQKDFFPGGLFDGCFISVGQLFVKFINVRGWLSSGDLIWLWIPVLSFLPLLSTG